MERWLLTYSDLITLLMALFIIMWAISAVNIGKFDELKASLKAAFSGNLLDRNTAVLSGDRALLNAEGARVKTVTPRPHQAATRTPPAQQLQAALARQDLENLQRIKRQLDVYAREHGFAGKIRTSIDERGLVVHLLTDDLLFDTGEAILKQRAVPLLTRIARLLDTGAIANPVRVEGNTDDVPISTAEYRSNWELSTARATAVLEELLTLGLSPARLSATGYADQRPVASNANPRGRRLNRRVDLVVLRGVNLTVPPASPPPSGRR
jgi:chemotaxis protein MotB